MNVTFVVINEVEHAIIDRGNGEFTSMPKPVYDQQQADMTIAEDPNGNN